MVQSIPRVSSRTLNLFPLRRLEMPPPPRCCQQFSSKNIACEQALLFGQATRASRERASEGPRGFAARSRVLARLVSLAQIGELARRLLTHLSAQFRVQMSHHGEQGKIKIETS